MIKLKLFNIFIKIHITDMSITAAVEGYSSAPSVSRSPSDIATFEKRKCDFCKKNRRCANIDIDGKVCGSLNICQGCMAKTFDQDEPEWCDVEIKNCDFCKKKDMTCLNFGLDGHIYGDIDICADCADKMFTESKSDSE